MKTSGIYKIQSKIKPKRIYIGSAKNLSKRWWNHLYLLRKNKHHSVALQNHFNKYSEIDLSFSTLLGCDKKDLVKVEQYFLDTYHPYFNTSGEAGRSNGMTGKHHTIESRIQQSKSHKGCKAWNKGTRGLMISWNKTPVCQYDKEGNFIRDWECAMYAGQELLIDNGNIGCVLKGKRKTAGGYIWKYKNVA